jgi:capsular polysaccharide biosynthesis protein
MQEPVLTKQIIAPCRIAPAHLVTARSHLIDRVVPECEILVLPGKEVAGGVLTFGFGPLPELPDNRGRWAQFSRPRSRRRVPEAQVIDLRRNCPQNWAHFLNNHLPILFHVAGEMGLSVSDIVAVTPERTPGYTRAAAELFGIRTLETDDIMEGEGIIYDARPWTSIRPARADWVRTAPVAQAMLQRIDAENIPSPARVFLSRRKTRTLENEAEASAWLGARGFVTVYPEDLDAAGQIRLFRQAEIMVAVHGAGLAPLLYAQPGGRLRQLVEILPCGHMTDVYRVMAGQVGCAWTGVRGKIKPEYIKAAYNFSAPFSSFSLDSFEVDLYALAHAFDLAGISG